MNTEKVKTLIIRFLIGEKELKKKLHKTFNKVDTYTKYCYINYILTLLEEDKNSPKNENNIEEQDMKYIKKFLNIYSVDIIFINESKYKFDIDNLEDSKLFILETIQDILESTRIDGSINKYKSSIKLVEYFKL